MHNLSQWEAIERILIALVAGAAIGFERERSGKPAGLRTHALVAQGSALFMVTSLLLGDQMWTAGRAYDPSRIASTVVQGVGFIAAGVIIRHKAQIHGLTTAAGLWVSSATGLLIGAGFYTVALVGVISTIFALVLLKSVEAGIDAAVNPPAAPKRLWKAGRWRPRPPSASPAASAPMPPPEPPDRATSTETGVLRK